MTARSSEERGSIVAKYLDPTERRRTWSSQAGDTLAVVRRGIAIVAVAAVGLLVASETSAAAVADSSPRRAKLTCGILPGDGAYSYVKTRGIRCAPAKRIAFRARKRFCRRHDDCLIDPEVSITTVHEGRVSYRGWRCLVKDGWELLVVRCHKGDRRLFYKTAA